MNLKYETVLVTGDRGYLLSNLLPYLETKFKRIITLPKDVDISDYDYINELKYKYDQIDCVIHFASPSDSNDFQDLEKVKRTMIDGSINLIKLAEHHKSSFIFASSMAADLKYLDNTEVYGPFKLAIERYLDCTFISTLILRIPRVYDKSRNKGLIKKLKENTFSGSTDNIVENVISLPEFIKQTEDILSKFLFSRQINNRIFHYEKLKNYSIKQISELFLKD